MSDQPTRAPTRRRFLRASAAAGATTLTGCSSVRRLVDPPAPADSPAGDQNWPEYRYDSGNTGHHPHATVPKDGVVLAWHHSTEFPVYSMPTAIDGVVYYGTQSGHHVAANALTGRVLWRQRTSERPIPQDGSFSKRGDVVVGGNGNLYARRAVDGVEIWSYDGYEGGYVYGSPKMVDSVAYLSVWDNVIAYDVGSREPLWRVPTRQRVESTPAIGCGRVFSTDIGGSLYAIDRSTGRLDWQFHVEETKYDVAVSPVVHDGTVFFPAPNERLYVLDCETGEVHWSLHGLFDPPTVVDQTVYATASNLLALDWTTGVVRWQYNPDEQGSGVNGTTCTDESVICSCTCGELVCLDRTDGAVRWRVDMADTGAFEGPVIAGEILVANGGDGLYAFSPA